MFITITVTEEARTTRFRVAPAQASHWALDVERTSERTPAAIVLLHCGVPYAPKLPGPRYPPGTGAGCGSSLAWWNRLTTTLSGALRLS